MYARLWSGRDIPVEEVRYDREGRLTLYRIAEEGLSAAKLGDSALIQGEELIALSSCGAPDYACALLSGVMSHPDRSVRIEQEGRGVLLDGLLQVDLSLGDNGCGTPLFDKKGNLVGISLRENMNYFTGIEKISSFVDKID
ncbi:MAG: trypsin-like peptidase domain-containing protein [Clostridia bacterium]|nr:trypsin-like peptidase domain-containing protein [Clostridia bacterium]